MAFCFQLRFRYSNEINCDDMDADIEISTFNYPLKLIARDSDSLRHAKWLVIRGSQYTNSEEARRDGLRLHKMLLVSGVKRNAGIHCGPREGDSISGLDILTENKIQLVGMDVKFRIGTPPRTFASKISPVGELSDEQLISAELINDSFFELSTEARFILRVSAIETLCKQGGRSSGVKKIIGDLLKGLDEGTPEGKEVAQILRQGKTESIGRACRSKIRKLLGKDAESEFDHLYPFRSKFLHEGVGRGALSDEADKALKLAIALLLHDLDD